jgi:hypothetical protein
LSFFFIFVLTLLIIFVLRKLAEKFRHIFHIETNYAKLELPIEFEPKVAKWLNNDPAAIPLIKRQVIKCETYSY